MKKTFITAASSLLGLILWAVPTLTLVPIAVNAQTNQPTNTQDNSSGTTANYNYAAQPGDSYTKMARKAVQTYGLTSTTELSGAQIIYAETNLTQQADSPVLDIGQKVSISKASVKSWVDKAQKLTPAQEAAWNYYVQFVDFNTNSVGQARS